MDLQRHSPSPPPPLPSLSSPSNSASSSNPSLTFPFSPSDSSLTSDFKELTIADPVDAQGHAFKQQDSDPHLIQPISPHSTSADPGPIKGTISENEYIMHQDSYPPDMDQSRNLYFSGYSQSLSHPPSRSCSRSSDRPGITHRTSSSYSKRSNISFDTSLREQPLLPFMSARKQQSSYNSPSHPSSPLLNAQDGTLPALSHIYDASGAFHQLSPPSEGPSSFRHDIHAPSKRIPSPEFNAMAMDTQEEGSSSTAASGPSSSFSSFSAPYSHPQQRTSQRSASGPVPPFGRPFSTPNASIAASVLSPSTSNGRIHSPTPVRAADRSSTASLPLPMLTPYHTLNPNRNLAHRTNLATDNEATNSMVVDGNLSLNIPPLPSSTYSRSSSSMSHPHARSASPPPYSPLSPPRSLHAHSPSYWQRRHGHTVNGHDSEEIPSSTSYPGVGGTGPGSRHHQLFYRDRSSLTSSISSEQSFPPPAPPTVLTPPPEEMAASNSAPHASILSQAGPAREEEIYIAVETVAREYRLLVRLPGYRRDSITLSIRKRRILHLVADSWEPGGGHFERRISFGYDAELSQVRAEFDGETLRVIVPRRGQLPVVYRNSRD